MNPILIDFGVIQIYWYSVIILSAILIGSAIFLKRAKKEGYKEDFLTDTLFYLIIFSILGARLYYVLFNFGYYMKHPLEIVAIWNGGLAIHGGIIAGSICLLYRARKNKKSFLRLTDLLVPSIILGQAIGRWGNFFNSEAHGIATSKQVLENLHIPRFIIKGMNIDGVYYHPTFLYESIWCLLGFILLIYLSKKVKLRRGGLTGIYFIWYSLARFFIESIRTDSLMLGPFKIAQVVSILLFLAGLYLLFRKKDDKRIKMLKAKVKAVTTKFYDDYYK